MVHWFGWFSAENKIQSIQTQATTQQSLLKESQSQIVYSQRQSVVYVRGTAG